HFPIARHKNSKITSKKFRKVSHIYSGKWRLPHFPHSQKGTGSRSLAPSTQLSQSMIHPLLRNASTYRNDPTHLPYPYLNMVDLSFRMSSATRLHDQVP